MSCELQVIWHNYIQAMRLAGFSAGVGVYVASGLLTYGARQGMAPHLLRVGTMLQTVIRPVTHKTCAIMLGLLTLLHSCSALLGAHLVTCTAVAA